MSTLSREDKDEMSAAVAAAIKAALAPVTAKLEEQSAAIAGLQTGFKAAEEWTIKAESVITECDAKIAAAMAAGGPGSNPSLTICDADCWVAHQDYPVLITSPADARAVRQAAVDWVIAMGSPANGRDVKQVELAFEPVFGIVLDPQARALAASFKVYKSFVSTVTYTGNAVKHGVPFADFARQGAATFGTEWQMAQHEAMTSFKKMKN